MFKRARVATTFGSLVLVANVAFGQDKLEPVINMFFNGMERHELSLVANASFRCSALYQMMGAILQRDTDDKQTVDGYLNAGSELLMIGMYTNMALFKHRGNELEQGDAQNRALGQLDMFMKAYSERMTQNQASFGEMFGSDELMKSDIEACQMISQIVLSEPWGETIVKNDWTFWDENL